MTGIRLVAAIACLAWASGCSTLGGTAFPPLGTTADRSNARAGDAADSAGGRGGSWLGRGEWWAGMRRRFAAVAADIRADLDFHETEGLEAFGPDAVDRVNGMRAEMNGEGGIGR